MGAVNTTYTFTPTDTITSTKMNNIIDETVMTADAVLGGSGGSGGLDISSGKLSISANAINSSRLAANSVTSTNIVDGTIVNADINASAAIAGTKISPDFGTQNIQTTGSATTGTLYLSRQDASTEGGELQFRKAFDATTAFTVDCQGAGHSPNLRIFGTTDQVATITAAGNVGVGTSSPSEKLTVIGPSGGTSALFSDNVNSTLSIKHETPGNLLTYETGGSAQQRWVLNGTEKARILSDGKVGIGKTNPSTILDVNGTVTATAFAGPLTGNVTGNVTGSSGSCTGNSATATLATKASTLSQGGGNGTAMTFNWNGQGGQPTWLWGGNDGVNHYVYNPSNFSVNYANSAGSAGSATTASTVSDGAITAAKLNGGQSGSAPIYGCRAWAVISIAPTRAVDAQANIASATKIDTTHTQITFPTDTQMPDTSYVVSGCVKNDAALDFSTYDHQTTGFKIRHSTETAGRAVQFMVIR